MTLGSNFSLQTPIGPGTYWRKQDDGDWLFLPVDGMYRIWLCHLEGIGKCKRTIGLENRKGHPLSTQTLSVK